MSHFASLYPKCLICKVRGWLLSLLPGLTYSHPLVFTGDWFQEGPSRIPKFKDAQVPYIKWHSRVSLVAQWLRICLPMQGTRVRALIQEDPTCRGATKPVLNLCSRACEPQLLSLCSTARKPQLLSPRATTTEARAPRAHAPQQREATAMRSPCTTMKSSPLSPQLEKACAWQRRHNAAKNK